MTEAFKHDVFIAYASPDAKYAKRLRSVLIALGYRVFRDLESLIPGDIWPDAITEAQRASLLTVVLISNRSPASYYQKAEILQAIQLARQEGMRRVAPVYLTGIHASAIPLPLSQLHGISWGERVSLLTVVKKIEAALRRSQRFAALEVHGSTIMIITGCGFLPEQLDRGIAYDLKAAIDSGRSAARHALSSLVMGDIYFMQHSAIQGHPNVISLGGPDSNALTKTITDEGTREKIGPAKRWQVFRHRVHNRWALFGNRAEDTHDAVVWFKDSRLPALLEGAWS